VSASVTLWTRCAGSCARCARAKGGAAPEWGAFMREIVLDTETTGLDPAAGHRIVEVACLELVNHVPTGRNFQRYVNPEREMPMTAYEVHGLSTDFLAGKPRFAEIAGE